MTDGTSQGLFIVVAIVIFGIFTLMAYILFEDTLSPALASMFSNATEQANNHLTVKNLIRANDLIIFDRGDPVKRLTDIKVGYDSITFKSNGENYTSGVYIPANKLQPDKKYIFSYDITDLGDSIVYIGGHVSIYNNVEMYFDGVRLEGVGNENDYNNAYHYAKPFPEDGKTHNIRVEFDTFGLVDMLGSTNNNHGIHIQPNRHYAFRIDSGGQYTSHQAPPYHVKIENIRLEYVN